MGPVLLPAAVAVFLWWFSTGAILWAVRRADRGGPGAHLNTTLAGLPMLALGLYGADWAAAATGPEAAYAGFASALLVWGWIELAFLTGIVTGWVRTPLPAACDGPTRFLRAFGTLAWHELALLAGLISVMVLSAGADHPFAAWTFLVLFFARISAKLNVFLGVPHINEEFLPRPLAHLGSYFRRRPMNPVFPVSVSALTFAAGCWIERLIAWEPGSGPATGFALLAALTLLALVEHWFMILPLPDAALWRWMLADDNQPAGNQVPVPRKPD